MNNKNVSKRKVLLYSLMIFAFLSNLWILKSSNSLTMDDFTTICSAQFNGYSDIFRILPSKSYNDRSVGVMFVKILNDMFGTNYKMYHYAFLIVHFINISLVYFIGQKIFKKDDNNYIYAILMAAIFGIYPVSLMAVQWIAAVYDLIGCLFVLFAIFFYLKSEEDDRYKNFYGILSIFSYYLSLRSKEMALVLPVILLVYEIGKSLKNRSRIKLPWFLYFNIIFMFGYAYILFTSGMSEMLPTNPYYQNFNPIYLFRNLIRYIILYSDLGNSSFLFNGLSMNSMPILILFSIIIIFSIVIAIKEKDFSLFLSIICTAGSFTVVLPMINMQHRLYVYIPSIFIGITCAIFLKMIVKYFNFKSIWECVFIIIPLLYLMTYTSGIIGFREYWREFCRQDAYTLEQMSRIEKPAENCKFYVKGASDGYNTFFYGPGNSLKLIFNDNSISTELVDDFPDNPEKPYVFLEYNNGNVSEISRSISKFGNNISVFPSEIVKGKTVLNDDGTIFISVAFDKIYSEFSIMVNGESMPTVIGEGFISTTVPADMLNNSQLEVCVIDNATKEISEKKIIPIT